MKYTTKAVLLISGTEEEVIGAAQRAVAIRLPWLTTASNEIDRIEVHLPRLDPDEYAETVRYLIDGTVGPSS